MVVGILLASFIRNLHHELHKLSMYVLALKMALDADRVLNPHSLTVPVPVTEYLRVQNSIVGIAQFLLLYFSDSDFPVVFLTSLSPEGDDALVMMLEFDLVLQRLGDLGLFQCYQYILLGMTCINPGKKH